jgi:hypothetical protein
LDVPDSRSTWGRIQRFEREPLERGFEFIGVTDIAKCFDYIDHGLLHRELVWQTGMNAEAEAVTKVARSLSGLNYGLPQTYHASFFFAEVVLSRLETALRRQGVDAVRFVDDFLLRGSSFDHLSRALVKLELLCRERGLSLNADKTYRFAANRYRARQLAKGKHLAPIVQARNDLLDALEAAEVADDLNEDYATFSDYLGSIDDSTAERDAIRELDVEETRSAAIGSATDLLSRWVGLVEENDPEASSFSYKTALSEALHILWLTDAPHGLVFSFPVLLEAPQLTPQLFSYLRDVWDDGGADVVERIADAVLRDRLYLTGVQLAQLFTAIWKVGELPERTVELCRWGLEVCPEPLVSVFSARPLVHNGLLSSDAVVRLYEGSPGPLRQEVAWLASVYMSESPQIQDLVLRDAPYAQFFFREPN